MFTIFILTIFIFIPSIKTSANEPMIIWGTPSFDKISTSQSFGGTTYSLEYISQNYNCIVFSGPPNDLYLYAFNVTEPTRMYISSSMYNINATKYRYFYVANKGEWAYYEGGSLFADYPMYIVVLSPLVNLDFNYTTPTPTPTPSPTPAPDYFNGFGDQNTPKGLKGWLKDLWSFITNPEDYGTIRVGDGDTLVYSTPTPQPTPTPYVQQQQIINPSTGEVIYNIETKIENSTSQVYPTDYVWLDDIPDTVPHEFDLNFSVSGTPTEYTTDLNFSETSDAFIDTVSGVSDGVNALGSLLGAMPIEIIIYPIVAFCIWAIFAFIHRLLG